MYVDRISQIYLMIDRGDFLPWQRTPTTPANTLILAVRTTGNSMGIWGTQIYPFEMLHVRVQHERFSH